MIYLIPAAGKATRFPRDKWGFKPLIMVEGKTLIEYSIRSLDLRHNDILIIVVLTSVHVIEIEKVLQALQIPCVWEIIVLENETSGQAATVYEVVSRFNSHQDLIIHNCDTAMNFTGVDLNLNCAGWMLLFMSNLPQLSYADIDDYGNVSKTAEKQVISNFASTGTYYFESTKTYKKYYQQSQFHSGEHYISPIYNTMISDNLKVRGFLAQNVFILGTPSELQSNAGILKEQWVPKW